MSSPFKREMGRWWVQTQDHPAGLDAYGQHFARELQETKGAEVWADVDGYARVSWPEASDPIGDLLRRLGVGETSERERQGVEFWLQGQCQYLGLDPHAFRTADALSLLPLRFLRPGEILDRAKLIAPGDLPVAGGLLMWCREYMAPVHRVEQPPAPPERVPTTGYAWLDALMREPPSAGYRDWLRASLEAFCERGDTEPEVTHHAWLADLPKLRDFAGKREIVNLVSSGVLSLDTARTLFGGPVNENAAAEVPQAPEATQPIKAGELCVVNGQGLIEPARADKALSLAVLGTALTTDVAIEGSYAAAAVHQQAHEDYYRGRVGGNGLPRHQQSAQLGEPDDLDCWEAGQYLSLR